MGALLAGLLLGFTACARVRPHDTVPSLRLGDRSSFPSLEAYGGAPIVGGNHVEILLNGEEIFPARLQAIRAAETTITYAQYFYDESPIGREIAAALANRCRAGVRVTLLLDGFGALGTPAEYVDTLRRSGCEVAYFRPLWRATLAGRVNNRNHRRNLVVDGRIGFTGGSGVGAKWRGDGRLEEHWRDTDVLVEGPAVQYMQAAFVDNWLEATGVALGGERYFPQLAPAGSVLAQIVTSAPLFGDFDMYTMFLIAIASARSSIYITNPYFVPDDRMANALTAAVARGVRVTVLVPGAIDYNIVRQASRHLYGRLLRRGVQIYEYQAGLLHAKTMVIDGLWSTIGSTNLDSRSLAINAELNLVTYDQAVAARLDAIFAADLAHARQVTYAQWSARPLWQRALELLAVPLRSQL